MTARFAGSKTSLTYLTCLLSDLASQVLLVVNHIIFLKNLSFQGSQSGPQRRTLRETATGPAAAGRAKGSGLSFLSEDSHNVVLDTLGVNDSGD